MITTITFNSDTPGDDEKLARVMHADGMSNVLWNIMHTHKNRAKRLAKEENAEPLDVLYEIIQEELEANNVNIDVIWE